MQDNNLEIEVRQKVVFSGTDDHGEFYEEFEVGDGIEIDTIDESCYVGDIVKISDIGITIFHDDLDAPTLIPFVNIVSFNRY